MKRPASRTPVTARLARAPLARWLVTGLGVVCSLIFTLGGLAAAQTTFSTRYSNTATNGDIALIGNVNYHCSVSPSQATSAQISACTSARSGGNVTNNAVYIIPVDTDGNPATSNSSSATLSLPAGSSVLFAGLYWSGISTSATNRSQVYFGSPASAGSTLSASAVSVISNAYQSFANVTSQVQAGGNGTYTVGNIASTAGIGSWAGWTLVVAYKNAALPTRNLSVFDGFQLASDPAFPVNITVSGFLTPSVGTVNSTVGVVAYDGDRGQLEGAAVSPNGSLRFGPNAASLSTVFNAVNPEDDVFNSSISALGSDVTAGRTPAYTNTLGLDTDTFKPNVPLPNGSTSAVVRVIGTGNDVIYPGVVTLATDIFVPNIKDSLTKSVTDVSGGPLLPGDLLEYELVIKNTGNDGALNVVLTDAIPANTAYVPGSIVLSGLGAGSKTDAPGDDQAEFDSAAGRVVARLGSGASATAGGAIAPGQEVRLKFRVKVNAGVTGGTTINNSGQVTYRQQTLGTTVTDISDSDAGQGGDQPARVLVSGPDLSVSKSHAGGFAQGQTGTFTLRVSNAGPGSTIGTVTVADTLPSGVSAQSLSGPGWSCTLSPLQCTRSDVLAAGSSYPDLTLVVSTPTPGDFVNTAAVSGGGEASTASGNNSDSDPFTVGATDLRLSKTGPASVLAGDPVTYAVTVWNRGPSPASGATISDPVPANLSGVTWTCAATGSATCSVPSGSGALSLNADLPANTSTSGDTPPTTGSFVKLTVTGTAGTGGSITNTASAAHPMDLTPNAASATTTVTPKADLSLTKTSDAGAGGLYQADTFTYTIVLSNAGPSATTVTFQDQTFSGVSLSGWVCAGTTGGATCPSPLPASGGYSGSALALPAGSSLTFKVTATVTASSGIASNTASLTPPGGVTDSSGPGNNAATVSTPILGGQGADLSLAKAGPALAKPGQALTYTLTVKNSGPAVAEAVSVSDTLPSGVTYVGSAPSAAVSGQTLTWNLGTLASGATQTLTVTATAPDAATLDGNRALGTLTNTASAGTTTRELNPANNAASLTTTLFAFKFTKTVRNITAGTPASTVKGGGKPGEALEYCAAVENIGAAPLTQFQIVDPVPANATVTPTAYDAEEPGVGTGYGIKLIQASPTYLTSAADTDIGSLTGSGGAFGRGVLTVNLGTVGAAATATACFQVTIR